MLSSILSFYLVLISLIFVFIVFIVIRSAIGHLPDEIVTNLLLIAAKETPVDGTTQIKW